MPTTALPPPPDLEERKPPRRRNYIRQEIDWEAAGLGEDLAPSSAARVSQGPPSDLDRGQEAEYQRHRQRSIMEDDFAHAAARLRAESQWRNSQQAAWQAEQQAADTRMAALSEVMPSLAAAYDASRKRAIGAGEMRRMLRKEGHRLNDHDAAAAIAEREGRPLRNLNTSIRDDVYRHLDRAALLEAVRQHQPEATEEDLAALLDEAEKRGASEGQGKTFDAIAKGLGVTDMAERAFTAAETEGVGGVLKTVVSSPIKTGLQLTSFLPGGGIPGMIGHLIPGQRNYDLTLATYADPQNGLEHIRRDFFGDKSARGTRLGKIGAWAAGLPREGFDTPEQMQAWFQAELQARMVREQNLEMRGDGSVGFKVPGMGEFSLASSVEGALNQVLYTSRFAASQRVGDMFLSPAQIAARKASSQFSFKKINPYALTTYVLQELMGGTRARALPKFDLNAEGELVMRHPGNSTGIALLKTATQEGLDFITEVYAWELVKATGRTAGRLVPRRARQWISAKTGAMLPSGIKRIGQKLTATKAGYDKSGFGQAMRAVRDVTGYHTWPEEIFIEEGMQQGYAAILNLENEFESAGFGNFGPSMQQLWQEVPNMAFGFMLVHMGQIGSAYSLNRFAGKYGPAPQAYAGTRGGALAADMRLSHLFAAMSQPQLDQVAATVGIDSRTWHNIPRGKQQVDVLYEAVAGDLDRALKRKDKDGKTFADRAETILQQYGLRPVMDARAETETALQQLAADVAEENPDLAAQIQAALDAGNTGAALELAALSEVAQAKAEEAIIIDRMINALPEALRDELDALWDAEGTEAVRARIRELEESGEIAVQQQLDPAANDDVIDATASGADPAAVIDAQTAATPTTADATAEPGGASVTSPAEAEGQGTDTATAPKYAQPPPGWQPDGATAGQGTDTATAPQETPPPAARQEGATPARPTTPQDTRPMAAQLRRRLFATFSSSGITDQEAQLAAVEHITGQRYDSRSQITTGDAQTVIAALSRMTEAERAALPDTRTAQQETGQETSESTPSTESTQADADTDTNTEAATDTDTEATPAPRRADLPSGVRTEAWQLKDGRWQIRVDHEPDLEEAIVTLNRATGRRLKRRTQQMRHKAQDGSRWFVVGPHQLHYHDNVLTFPPGFGAHEWNQGAKEGNSLRLVFLENKEMQTAGSAQAEAYYAARTAAAKAEAEAKAEADLQKRLARQQRAIEAEEKKARRKPRDPNRQLTGAALKAQQTSLDAYLRDHAGEVPLLAEFRLGGLLRRPTKADRTGPAGAYWEFWDTLTAKERRDLSGLHGRGVTGMDPETVLMSISHLGLGYGAGVHDRSSPADFHDLVRQFLDEVRRYREWRAKGGTVASEAEAARSYFEDTVLRNLAELRQRGLELDPAIDLEAFTVDGMPQQEWYEAALQSLEGDEAEADGEGDAWGETIDTDEWPEWDDDNPAFRTAEDPEEANATSPTEPQQSPGDRRPRRDTPTPEGDPAGQYQPKTDAEVRQWAEEAFPPKDSAPTVEEAQERYGAALRQLPSVRIVPSMADLPADILHRVDRAVQEVGVKEIWAFVDNGVPYIVLDQSPSLAEVRKSIVHELEHIGLGQLPADVRTSIWQALEFAAVRNAAMRRIMDEVRAAYPGLKTETAAGRDLLMQEVLARLAERKGDLRLRSTWQKVVAAIKEWIQSIGHALGLEGYDPDLAAVEAWTHRALDRGLRQAATTPAQTEAETVQFRAIGQQGAARLDNADEVVANLATARQMLAGRNWQELSLDDKRKIKASTGWELGGDGKWRYELPGGDVRIDKLSERGDFFGKLGELLDDSELLAAFPDLKSVDVQLLARPLFGAPYNGLFDKELNLLKVFYDARFNEQGEVGELADYHKEQIKEIIVHELQHYIQEQEGFAEGSNPRVFEDYRQKNPPTEFDLEFKEIIDRRTSRHRGTLYDFLKRLKPGTVKNSQLRNLLTRYQNGEVTVDQMVDEVFANHRRLMNWEHMAEDMYHRVAGEVEARNMQTRRSMTQAERRASLLEETEDVAEKDKIYWNKADGPYRQASDSIRFRTADSQQQQQAKEDLIVTHSLTADNLRHAAHMGGLAVPSLAVTQKDQALTKFGEITLIGTRDLVDPRRGTRVFGADIYSPRYPTIHRRVNTTALNDLNRQLEALHPHSSVNLEMLTTEGADALWQNTAFLARFLQERGHEAQVATHPGLDAAEAARMREHGLGEFLNVKSSDQLQNDPAFQAAGTAYLNSQRDATLEWARERFGEGTEKYNNLAQDMEPSRFLLEELANKISRAAREQGTINSAATISNLRQQIRDAGLLDEYKAHADDTLQSLTESEQIYQGRDSRGRRRYLPHTLERVVSLLKRDLRSGESFFYGLGNLRARVTPQFKSIRQIRQNKDLLTDPAHFEKIKAEIDQEFDKLGESIGFNSTHTAEILEDAATQSASRAIERAMRDYRQSQDTAPEASVRAVERFIDKLRNMPTEYFEAKPMRSVALSEFAAAVVPDNATPATLDLLRQQGITEVHTYPAADREARQQLIHDLTGQLHEAGDQAIRFRTADHQPDAAQQPPGDRRPRRDTATTEPTTTTRPIRLTPRQERVYFRGEGIPHEKYQEARAHLRAVLEPKSVDLFGNPLPLQATFDFDTVPAAPASTERRSAPVSRADTDPASDPAPRADRVQRQEDTPAASAHSPQLTEIRLSKLDRARISRRTNAERAAWYEGKWQQAFEAVGPGRPVLRIIPELISSALPQGVPIQGMQIRGPADIYALATTIRSPYFESFKVYYVNDQLQGVQLSIVSIGAVDAALVYPSMILRQIPEGATGLFVAHNHPSGDPIPSPEDVRLTKNLAEVFKNAGLKFYDHVITNGEKFISLRNSYQGTGGLYSSIWSPYPAAHPTAPASAVASPVTQAEWELAPLGNREGIFESIVSAGNIASIAANFGTGADLHSHVFYLSKKLSLMGVERLPNFKLAARNSTEFQQFAGHIARNAAQSAGQLVVIQLAPHAGRVYGTAIKQLTGLLDLAGVSLLEIISSPESIAKGYISHRSHNESNFREAPASYPVRQSQDPATDTAVRFRTADQQPGGTSVTSSTQGQAWQPTEAGDQAIRFRTADHQPDAPQQIPGDRRPRRETATESTQPQAQAAREAPPPPPTPDALVADLLKQLKENDKKLAAAEKKLEKAQKSNLALRRAATESRKGLAKLAGTTVSILGGAIAAEVKAIDAAIREIARRSREEGRASLRFRDAQFAARYILDAAAGAWAEKDTDLDGPVQMPKRILHLERVIQALQDMEDRINQLPASDDPAIQAELLQALHADTFLRIAGRSTNAKKYIETQANLPTQLVEALRKEAEKRLKEWWGKRFYRLYGGETVYGRVSAQGRTIPRHHSKGLLSGREQLAASVMPDVKALLSEVGVMPDNSLKTPLDQLEWHQVKDFVERAAELYAQSERAKEEVATGHKTRREEADAAMAREVIEHGPKPLDSTLGNPRQTPVGRWLNTNLRNFHGLVSWLAGGMPAAKSIVRQAFGNSFWRAQWRYLEVKSNMHRAMLAKIESLGWKRADLVRMSTEVRPWKLRDGRTVHLTVAEVATLFGMLHNEDATDKLSHNGTKSQRFRNNRQRAEERRIDPLNLPEDMPFDQKASARLAQYQHLVDQLPADMKEFVSWIVSQSGLHAELANETSRRLHGVDKFTDPSYWTLLGAVERPQKETTRDTTGVPKSYGGMLERAGIQKQRQMHRHVILLGDVFSVVSQQHDMLAAYIGMAEAERDLQGWLSSGEFHDALVERIGSEGVNELKKTIRLTTGQEGLTDSWGVASKAIAKVQSNMAVGILGFRPTSILANRVGGSALLLTMIWRDHGPAAAARFLARGFKPIRPQWASKKSRALVQRLLSHGYLYDRWVDTPFQTFTQVTTAPDDPGQVKVGAAGKLALAWSGLKELSMKPMALAEMRNAMDAYETLIASGVSEDAALETVAEYTALTQNPSTTLEQTGIYRRTKHSVLSSTILPFYGQPTVMQNLFAQAITEARHLKKLGKPQEALRWFNAAFLGIILSAVWTAAARWFVRDSRKSKLGKVSEEDFAERALYTAFDVAREIAETTGGPFAEEVVDFTQRLVSKKRHGEELLQFPESMLGTIIENGNRIIRAAPKILEGDEEATWRALRAASELTSAATGAPLGGPLQAVDVVTGLTKQALED